jgi:hypothetical protein
MELSKQVVSLELAKKLKELGVTQRSLFYWSRYGRDTIPEDDYDVYFQSVVFKIGTKEIEYFSAFTVAELGEMLPRGYMSFHNSLNKWYCEDLDTFIQPHYKAEEYDTEADARAKMLIYLLENNLITK